MVVYAEKNESKLTITVNGILDTSTVSDLEEKIDLSDISELVFDFTGLESISSSGIRVLIYCQQIMNNQGSMKIYHPGEVVYEIFEVTGLDQVFEIER